MNNKKEFEATWLCAILTFFAFPAMIIIGNSGKDGFTSKEGLTITLIVYLVNFTVSLIYVTICVPENRTFKERITALRGTLLISSFTITSPFILLYSIREFIYKIIRRIKDKETLIPFDRKKRILEIKDYIYQEKRIKRKIFVSTDEFKINLTKLTQEIKSSFENSEKEDVKELKFNFWFITNNTHKAEQLTSVVKKKYYDVYCGNSLEDSRLFVISGWTSKMKLTDEVLIQWINEMCELGYQYDCNFENWSTESY
jgi:hypothetical protein